MEDAHGPPASEGRVGLSPLACEAAQRMTLFAFLLVDHWLLPWLQPAGLMEFVPAG
jgi:hypothetical protein